MVKKGRGSNDKNLDIILFAYSREVWNLCFVAVGLGIHELWPYVHVTSKRLYVIGFFTDFISVYSDTRKIYPSMDSHKHNGTNCKFVCNCICKLQIFCMRMFLYLLYKLIFLLLLLCRAVTPKVTGIKDWNFAKAYILLCRLMIRNFKIM